MNKNPQSVERLKNFKQKYDPKKTEALVVQTREDSANLNKITYHSTASHHHDTHQGQDHNVKPLGAKKFVCEIL